LILFEVDIWIQAISYLLDQKGSTIEDEKEREKNQHVHRPKAIQKKVVNQRYGVSKIALNQLTSSK